MVVTQPMDRAKWAGPLPSSWPWPIRYATNETRREDESNLIGKKKQKLVHDQLEIFN